MMPAGWAHWLLIAVLGVSLDATAASPLPLANIKLPPGFKVTLFASVPNARQMALGKRSLFVGSMGRGRSTPSLAHVAALGMRFYTGHQFPAQYKNVIFIAEHGSWNRARKSAYRISVVRLQDQRVVAYEPFATGWLQVSRRGAVRPMCRFCPTAVCSYRTIWRARFTV